MRFSLLVVLSCVLASLVRGSTLASEEKVQLGLAHASALVWDSEQNTLWVGGADQEDAAIGRVVGIKFLADGQRQVLKGVRFGSPVLSGSKRLGKIYWGMRSGEVAELDVAQRRVTRTWPAKKDQHEVTSIVADQDEEGLWMSTRREANGVTSWCFQEYYRFPDLAPVPNAFSGHFPGPCTSMIVDTEDKVLYFTDSGWRGRWPQLRNAGPTFSVMWENDKMISAAALLDKVFYVLLLTGRVDMFKTGSFNREGAPDSSYNIKIDDHGDAAIDRWRSLVADTERQVLWAASEEEGKLVELVPVEGAANGLVQQGAVPLKDTYGFGAGTMIQVNGVSTLAILDVHKQLDANIVLLQFRSDCVLGDRWSCKCYLDSELKRQVCTLLGKNVVVNSGDVLVIPRDTEVRAAGDVEIKRGAQVSIHITSMLSAPSGTITIDGSQLYLTDGGPGPFAKGGTYRVLEASGGIKGVFASAGMTRMMLLSRMFMCAQLPRVRLTVDEKVTVQLTIVGKKCYSPLVTLPLLGLVVGAVIYGVYGGRLQDAAATKEEKTV